MERHSFQGAFFHCQMLVNELFTASFLNRYMEAVKFFLTNFNHETKSNLPKTDKNDIENLNSHLVSIGKSLCRKGFSEI